MTSAEASRGGHAPPRDPQIILIGLRCSGKTTVAKILGEQLHLAVDDLDTAVLKRLGRDSIAEIWRTLGEAAWRKAEAAVLEEVLSRGPGILALGGGTPMIDSARGTLVAHRERSGCRIVYLRAAPATLARRLQMNGNDRPPLIGKSAAEEMEAIFAQRDAFYRILADMTIESDDLSPAQIAGIIAREYGRST